MKIYTKTGDKGMTSLLGGSRVPKHHLRIEAYGTVDELNSWIGLLRDQQVDDHTITVLLSVQDRLFTIGSHLAMEPSKNNIKLPELSADDISRLEMEMDRMTEELTPLKSFILPGGHFVISYMHIARCVCRRAERIATHLAEESAVNEEIIKYLNRLSDYLFVVARFTGMRLNVADTPWSPGK